MTISHTQLSHIAVIVPSPAGCNETIQSLTEHVFCHCSTVLCSEIQRNFNYICLFHLGELVRDLVAM